MVTHDALAVVVQLHPVGDVTVTVPLPPVPGTDWLVGEIVTVQDAAA